MFAEIEYPIHILEEELDVYLDKGWYRMGQSMFTTNFLRFNKVFYSAYWLRIPLESFEFSKSQLKLLNTCSRFSLEIKKAAIDSDKDELFAKYKSSVAFEASSSLQFLLYSEGNLDIFNTLEFCLYDQKKLIGCGFLDLGKKSTAGISCFYDPDYKKYSLGKYLMLLKIKYSIKNGYSHFYPGYFAPGYPLFDYKLSLSKNKIEYFCFTNSTWQTTSEEISRNTPLEQTRKKTEKLHSLLSENNIKNKIFEYEYYDANLIENLYGLDLMSYPIFISLSPESSLDQALIVYDFTQNVYKLLLCLCYIKTNVEQNSGNFFSTYVLKIDSTLFETDQEKEIIQLVKAAQQQI